MNSWKLSKSVTAEMREALSSGNVKCMIRLSITRKVFLDIRKAAVV